MRTIRKAVAAVALSAAAVGLAPMTAEAHAPGTPAPDPIDLATPVDRLETLILKALAGTANGDDVNALITSLQRLVHQIEHGVLG